MFSVNIGVWTTLTTKAELNLRLGHIKGNNRDSQIIG